MSMDPDPNPVSPSGASVVGLSHGEAVEGVGLGRFGDLSEDEWEGDSDLSWGLDDVAEEGDPQHAGAGMTAAMRSGSGTPAGQRSPPLGAAGSARGAKARGNGSSRGSGSGSS